MNIETIAIEFAKQNKVSKEKAIAFAAILHEICKTINARNQEANK